ncbi:hypothetical protein WA158_004026 [Blastocystis sp. Blastoise]
MDSETKQQKRSLEPSESVCKHIRETVDFIFNDESRISVELSFLKKYPTSLLSKAVENSANYLQDEDAYYIDSSRFSVESLILLMEGKITLDSLPMNEICEIKKAANYFFVNYIGDVKVKIEVVLKGLFQDFIKQNNYSIEDEPNKEGEFSKEDHITPKLCIQGVITKERNEEFEQYSRLFDVLNIKRVLIKFYFSEDIPYEYIYPSNLHELFPQLEKYKLKIAGSCSTGEYEVILERQYASNSGEVVKIASAESSFLRNNIVFRDESVATQDSKVEYKVCLDGNTDYSLELSSKGSIAWVEGSFVSLTCNHVILVNSRLNADDNGKKIIKFNLSTLLASNNNWKYATSVDTTSWKESKLEEFGEDYKNKEIKNAGSSVYFRKDITVDDSFAVIQIAVQSQSGFIVYVNGIKVDTYLLPESSKINENTPSQSLEDIPAYKHIIVPKELLASSVSLTTLKIAIELHTTADHPEILSSFDALTYITNFKDSMDTLSMLASRRLQDIPQYTMNAFEENQSIDFSTILSLSLSNCVLSTDLPTGLTLSSNCILSGTPKEVKSAKYTLSYTDDEDGSSSNTYIFNLQILCNPTSCAHVRVNRITTNFGSSEQVILKSEDGNEITTLIQGNWINQNYDYYGPVGSWSFELIKETSGAWSDDSIMTVYVIDDISSTSIAATKMRTIYKSPEIYYVNTNYSMLMKSQWKYNTYNSLPTAWYGSSIDDSSWSTINSGAAITPTVANQYFVFHKTINTPSIVNQKYFILSYKTISNTKIYINNHELATHGFIDGYLDSADASTSIDQTATGPLSLFDNQETITISVLLYDKQHTIDISFDASLLMVVDTNLPVYGNYEVTATNDLSSSNYDYIVDLNIDSYMSITGNSDKSDPIISISMNDGYKYINRYCITRLTGNSFLSAPKSWKVESIDINGVRHEHSVVSDAFKSIDDPRRRCFFLSDVTTGTNKLEFTLTNNMINKVENKYSISEIELFVDDITSETLPLLSTSSNPYYAYDNTTILISLTNSDYYHHFTITPSLRAGASFDTNTGSIYGIIHGYNGDNIYTIHATSVIGTPYEYTLTIHIQSCQFPNNFVNIQLEYEQGAVYEIPILDNMVSQTILSIYHIYEKSSEDYNICFSPSTYFLYVNMLSGQSSSVSHVYLNNVYYGEFNQNNYVSFSFLQYVDASKMPIVYSYDNITPPKHWNTNLFNDDLWSTVPSSSSLPNVPSDSITQYYRIHYTVEQLIAKEYQLDITVSTYAGMIIYMNGYEVRRVNMNNGDNVEYNTLANSKYNEYKSFRSVVTTFIDPRIRIIGDNIIAIEIHKFNTVIQPKNGLSIVINIVNIEDSLITGSWSVNGEVDPKYPLSNIEDRNSYTYTEVLDTCSSTIFTYTYNDEICIDVNNFYLYYQHAMSLSYSPVTAVIEGTYNNGAQWDELSTMDGITINKSNSKNFHLNKCYNSYRMRITKCGTDTNISESDKESMTIVNELRFNVYTDSGCVDNEWSSSGDNQYSYKICPKGYTSNAKRLCSYNFFKDTEGDETCIKINPSELYFEETNIIIKINDFYEQYYTIDALNTVITSSPSLPEGIMIDSETQKLYGTPTIPSPPTTYTLSYTNNEGIVVGLHQISITVTRLSCLADNNWLETNLESTASLPCPQGYTGNQSRYCNNIGMWEDPDLSECIFSSAPCTGTTYYNGNECVECENGITSSLNGNNYLCTPCEEGTYAYNNKCFDHLYCEADGNWPQTNPKTTTTISCPFLYKGDMTRYCNDNMIWEEENTSNCVELPPCTGSTYLSGTECVECVGGGIITENGKNIACTPCGDDEYLYNYKCLSNNNVCSAKSYGLLEFPKTQVGRKAALSCSNDKQFGYYYVSCDYISGVPTWSNDIDKRNCYPRPSVESGKGLQLLDYTFYLKTCIDDITDIIVSYSRTFIHTYPYELTDLKMAPNYDENACNTLPLQVYYGTNTEIYDSATYKQKLFIKHVSSSTSNIQESLSSLDNKKCYLYDSENGCQHLQEGYQMVPTNSYHSDTYFCKQHQLKYTSIPVRSFETSNTNIFILGITIDKIENHWIDPDTIAIIYKSIIASIDLPLKQLQLVDTTSNTLSKLISFSFYVAFPEQIEINSDSLKTHINTSLLKEQIKTILTFENSEMMTQLNHFENILYLFNNNI